MNRVKGFLQWLVFSFETSEHLRVGTSQSSGHVTLRMIVMYGSKTNGIHSSAPAAT